MLVTAVTTDCRIAADIVSCRSNTLSPLSPSGPSMSLLGSPARDSQSERSIDVPNGRSGGAAGIPVRLVVEDRGVKITLLIKLSRRNEVSDEKSANSGPNTFCPGTLAVGGKKLKTDGALKISSFISAEPIGEGMVTPF